MIPSYPKVHNLGHPNIANLFNGPPVVVQEKVDGSQFSFGVINGRLYARSKGAPLIEEGEVVVGGNNMFGLGIAYVQTLWLKDALPNNHIFRGEYLQKPKHNTLAYDRIPANHIILFDVEYRDPDDIVWRFGDEKMLLSWADALELDMVPYFYPKNVSPNTINKMLMQQSVLGGQLIEGVVFKNYHNFGADGKFLAGKHVSEHFKETHKKDWKVRNPGGMDLVQKLTDSLRTPARWDKAIQHLAERGELQNAPQDIGPLMKEVALDVLAEEEEWMKDQLFKWAWPRIQRGLTAGLPQWYKDKLMESQFDSGSTTDLPESQP